jgi:hypothetical protein
VSIARGHCRKCLHIAIHALVMATVVQPSSLIAGAKDTARQSLRLTIVMMATVSIATVPVLMAAHFSEVMVWSLAYAIVGSAPAGADLRGAATKTVPRAESRRFSRTRNQGDPRRRVINLKTAKVLGIAADSARPRRRGDRISLASAHATYCTCSRQQLA